LAETSRVVSSADRYGAGLGGTERRSESFLKRLWLGLARAGERDPVLGRVYLVCHHMPPNRFAWRHIGSRIRIAFVDIPGDKVFRVGGGGISLRLVDCRSSHTRGGRRSLRGHPIFQRIRKVLGLLAAVPAMYVVARLAVLFPATAVGERRNTDW